MIKLLKKIECLRRLILVQIGFVFIFVYLFMVFLPNYIGCLVPDKMCLIGSSKLTDVFTVSAALLPTLLIFYGYRVWRNQKAKEILATKAQEIYHELDHFISALDVFNEELRNNPGTTSTSSKTYIEFKRTCRVVLRKIKLFDDLLADEKSIHSNEFKKSIDKLEFFNGRLGLIDLWRIDNSNGHSLIISHYHRIKDNLGFNDVRTEIPALKSILVKIILHK